MENKRYKCKKCGSKMKKSGPYLPRKEESQPAHKGSLPAYYSCMNENCENFMKGIEVPEK